MTGTGKTTSVTRQIHRAIAKYGPDAVLVTSFSRAAAAELAGRELPIAPDRIGTLHSHCFHALGGPEIAEAHVDEWNRDNPRLAITPVKKHGKLDGEDNADGEDEMERDGDKILQQLSRFRGMMQPPTAWPPQVRGFEKKWVEYKRSHGLLDFTDLIETCYRDVAMAPKQPAVIFADEAQDLNRMQLSLVRKWGRRADYFIVAGDDDQASLPGTLVLMEGGHSIPVECLDPTRHRLAAYDTLHSELKGLRKGYGFELQRTLYRGDAVSLRSAGRATCTTHNHPWLFRWTPAANDKHIVYLMRKGNAFRVGWCKLIRADGCCHLTVRAHQERADAAWILRVCESRSEASLWESYVAAEFGISTALWRPIHDQRGGHYTPEVIAELVEMLGDQTERGRCCLAAFGRDMDFPFYRRGNSNRYGARTSKTAAANLLPEVMAVPIAERIGRHEVVWRPIGSVGRFPYDGFVYGLSVPPHHTYVADGIVTHNCIYTFTGAQPEAILDPDIPANHKIILKQSYRVPRTVHRFAESLIRQVGRRQEKQYLPREHDGALEKFTAKEATYLSAEGNILSSAMRHVESGKSVMFLAACAYMLRPLVAVLRKNGIPFHNPYRKSNGYWNPLRIGRRGSSVSRILSLLVGHSDFGEGHRPWTYGDVALWAEWLNSKGVLKHGAKKNLAAYEAEGIADIDAVFEPAALQSLAGAWAGGYGDLLEWWRARVTADVGKRVQFPVAIAKMRGPQALIEPPKIVVGTIHSVKGGQADIVYLFPDLSQAGDAQYCRGGASRDAVIRVFYVGATRARENLYICRCANRGISL